MLASMNFIGGAMPPPTFYSRLCSIPKSEELLFFLQYLDETGAVMSYEETDLPTIIMECDWLVV